MLAACLMEKGAEQLRGKIADRLETTILDVTKTESITAATQWVKERVGDRGMEKYFSPFIYLGVTMLKFSKSINQSTSKAGLKRLALSFEGQL